MAPPHACSTAGSPFDDRPSSTRSSTPSAPKSPRRKADDAARRAARPSARALDRPARLPRRRSSAKAATGHALIAEIKKASPSKGLIRADFDPPAHARAYQAGGAACLSVLTDEPWFQGDDAYPDRRARRLHAAGAAQGLHGRSLAGGRSARDRRRRDPDHRRRARRRRRWPRSRRRRSSCGMDVLVEVHDEAELERALKLKSRLIGVNNRDLRDFTVDFGAHLRRWSQRMPAGTAPSSPRAASPPWPISTRWPRRRPLLPGRRDADAPGRCRGRDAGAAASAHDGAASPISTRPAPRAWSTSRPRPSPRARPTADRPHRHVRARPRSAIRDGAVAEGRRARRRARRRHHGRQAHRRPDPALPPAADHPASRSISSLDDDGRRRAPRPSRPRTDRRRDGGADRRLGRAADDLRHGQGGRSRHGDRRRAAARQSAAAARATGGPSA